ncbi:MAG: hypothetical protein CMJ83_21785, partial [Planctomycetes bacterium]|nr:hypothetical protein [Planctomycetota bacterium]
MAVSNLPRILTVLLIIVGHAVTVSAQPDRGSRHWAYRAPVRRTPPDVVNGAWVRNAIDRFALARLELAGISPASALDRARLIRRLSLDLIGLPPTLAEVDAFANDRSPHAYERLVDRLLASARYGEHFARHWLDLARYADSNGFQADQLRESWAYRDWVIDAMNRDLPYDQFAVEQIAGDLLPQPTLAQRIATGFNRAVPCNVEAGVHPEANRVDQVVDRVNTTATVWLGSTLACAQCHDHKYDPFSQSDYYRVFAFFNQTPLEVKNPGGKGVRFDFWGPTADLPLQPEQTAERTRLRSEAAGLQKRLDRMKRDRPTRAAAWEQRARRALSTAPRWRVLEIAKFSSTGDEDAETLGDGSVLVGGRLPGTATYT